MPGQSEQRAGQHAGASRGGGRDDDPHRGIDLLHRQGGGQGGGEGGIRQRSPTGGEAGGVAAHQARHREHVARQAAVHRRTHDIERPLESGLDLVATAQSFGRFGPKGKLSQRNPVGLGLGDGIEQ